MPKAFAGSAAVEVIYTILRSTLLGLVDFDFMLSASCAALVLLYVPAIVVAMVVFCYHLFP